MKILRNILWSLLILTLAAALALGAVTAYLYRHPDTARSAVEDVLSGLLNGRATVEAISFGWHPLRLAARGVRLRSGAAEAEAAAYLADVRAEAELTGPFGQRTLTVKRMELSRWRLRLPAGFSLAPWEARPASGTWLTRMAGSAVRLLLFRRVRLENVRVDAGEVEVQAPDWRVSLALDRLEKDADGRLQAEGAGRFESPSRALSAQASGFRVATVGGAGPGQAVLGADVTLEQGLLRHDLLEVADIVLQTRVFYDLERNRLSIDSADLRGRGTIPAAGGLVREEIHTIELHLGPVWYDPGRQAGAVSSWRMRSDDWLEFEGSVSYGTGDGKGLQLDIGRGRVQGRKLLELAARQTASDLPSASMEGDLGVSGSLKGGRQGETWHWRFASDVRLAGNRVALDAAGNRVSGELAGRLEISGNPAEARVKSDLRLSDGLLEQAGAGRTPFTLLMTADGVWPELQVAKLDLQAQRVAAAGLDSLSGLRDLRLGLRDGRINARGLSFDFTDGELAASAVGPLRVSLSGDTRSQKISLEGRDVGLAGFLHTAGWLPAAWKLEGTDRLRVRATIGAGSCRFDAEVDLEQVGFEVPGDTALGEGVGIRLASAGQFDPGRRQLEFSADAHLFAGEGLYRQFYFDFSRQPVDLALRGVVDLGRKRWQVSDLSLALKDVVRLQSVGQGGWGEPGADVDLRLNLPQTAVGPLYTHFARDPFGDRVPALKRLAVGGKLAADLDLHAGIDGQRVRGRLRWSDGEVVPDGGGPMLSGADIDFPVWYRSGAPADGSGPQAGRFTVRQVVLPVIGALAVDWPLHATANRLDIDAPTRFDFGGGTVELGPMHLVDIYAPERLLTSGISVTSVDSSRFLRALWPDAVLGTAGGHLAVSYRDGRLLSRGRMTAEVFGGRVTVVDPSLAALFSAVPVFGCDVLLEDLMLSELTAGTPFGRIDGVLRGSIRDLEIVARQPQRFDLLVETERRKGISQRISVKAVDSISQIGGGQSPFMGLAGSALKLLPGFGYRKIGIRSALQNDVFTVNGTIHDGGVEYLVRRDGLAGVDVVNRDPNNRIRFTEMVKRIRRAMAPEGKPVVNVNQ